MHQIFKENYKRGDESAKTSQENYGSHGILIPKKVYEPRYINVCIRSNFGIYLCLKKFKMYICIHVLHKDNKILLIERRGVLRSLIYYIYIKQTNSKHDNSRGCAENQI